MSAVAHAAVGPFDWKPVSPEQLAEKTPTVDKDADAEALLWEVRIHDDWTGGRLTAVQDHYLRIKVFTERGKASLAQIDIPFLSAAPVSAVAARTIKPDGTIVEIKGKDVFERTILKKRGLKIKAKSFALPDVEPGAIIEYRWREMRTDELTFNVELPLQREIPVRVLKYSIKPVDLGWTTAGMRAEPFHTARALTWVTDPSGYQTTTLTNMPAYKEEPYMPPENEVRAWMLVHYSMNADWTAEKFWKEYARTLHSKTKSRLSPDDTIRAKARELTAGAVTDAEKLERLYDFCRREIKRVDGDTDDLSAEERDKALEKENRSPKQTLARGVGTDWDIVNLFGALASAVTRDVRMAQASDRSRFFFRETLPSSYMLRRDLIAVADGAQWRLFDPSARCLPAGMLRWQNEGLKVLIADPVQARFVESPPSLPAQSVSRRTARFRLSEEGTLEGDVETEYTGHTGFLEKARYDDLSPEQRVESLRDALKERVVSAEVSNVKVENATDPDKPMAISYHVRVPGYAQRTGKRLFVRPAFFEYGLPPAFPGSARQNHVYFPYPWSEQDKVTIELPRGFELDQPQSPASLSGGAAVDYKVTLMITRNPLTLVYERAFTLGGDGSILYEKDSYPTLKRIFDTVHQQDGHSVALKQAGRP
jgi:hypothetical protein